ELKGDPVIPLRRPSAGRFRAMARQCVVGRPRGPAPLVLVACEPDATTLYCDFGDVALSLRTLSGGPVGRCWVPMTLLDAVQTSRARVPKIDPGAGRGTGNARQKPWPPISDAVEPHLLPKAIRRVDGPILTALHDQSTSGSQPRRSRS